MRRFRLEICRSRKRSRCQAAACKIYHHIAFKVNQIFLRMQESGQASKLARARFARPGLNGMQRFFSVSSTSHLKETPFCHMCYVFSPQKLLYSKLACISHG
jgi:hypothetical protein